MSSDHPNAQVPGHDTRIVRSFRASELFYRRLLETTGEGILILDFDTGRIKDVNPFLFRLLGLNRAEMVGKILGELSPFKDTELGNGMYKISGVHFDMTGKWMVRFHFFETCLDTEETSKHAHVSFWLNVP